MLLSLPLLWFRIILELKVLSYDLGTEEYLETVKMAKKEKTSAYDCTYVVLAQKLGVPLVTTDHKMASIGKDKVAVTSV